MKKENLKNAITFDELLDIQYGKIGTKKRNEFEENAQYYVISEMLKEARKEANLTQEELAKKVGTKKVISQDWKTGNATYSFLHFTEFLNSGLEEKLI